MSMIGKSLVHYEITSEIGRGGMGEVYQAKDTKLGRDVAIKVLPEEFALDTDRVARFQREAKLLASLNHPKHGSTRFALSFDPAEMQAIADDGQPHTVYAVALNKSGGGGNKILDGSPITLTPPYPESASAQRWQEYR